VIQGARDALDRYGTGMTGSRFLNGTIDLHLDLEREIAEWMGTEEAIVFTTGHQANVGTLGTLLGPGDTVIADSGDHASILDGCLLSRAKLRPFRHNRMDLLEKALRRGVEDGGGVLVVVDGVFSMEGDIAPLPQIVELCQAYGARLMVDEAHAAGVLGARAAGSCELFGVEDRRRPAHGHVLQEPRLVRRLHRRPARRDRLPARPVARVHVHRRGGARGGRRRPGGAADHPVRRGPGPVREGARQRALPQPRAARPRLPRRPAARASRRHERGDGDRPRGGRRRLEGRDALARTLRRGRLRQRGAAPGRALRPVPCCARA
jgi:hypothetical protein